MCDTLGYRGFCTRCIESIVVDGKITCNSKNSPFYGIVTKDILLAPCIKVKESEVKSNE